MGKNNETPVEFIETTSTKLSTVQGEHPGAFIHVNDENGDDTLYIGDDQVTDKLNMGEDINNLDGETVKVGNFKPQNYGQLKDMTVSEILREMFRPIGVSSISLNKSSATLRVGGTTTITATVSPSDATNATVTWSTSDSTVATVSASGKVTAKKVGSVTITARAGGKSATCTITVEPTPPTVSASNSVSISYSGPKLIGTDENLLEKTDIDVTIVDGSWSDGTPYAGGHDDIVLTMNPDMWGQQAEEGTYTISGSVEFYEGQTPKDNAGNDHTTHYTGGTLNVSTPVTIKVVNPIYINGYMTREGNDGKIITEMRRYVLNYDNSQELEITIPAETYSERFEMYVPYELSELHLFKYDPTRSDKSDLNPQNWTIAYNPREIVVKFVEDEIPGYPGYCKYVRDPDVDNSYNTDETLYKINLKK